MRVTYIIPVLESRDVVRRQSLHLGRIMPGDWELIVVDDGSNPPLQLADGQPRQRIIQTNDTRPWTTPRARNIGAWAAQGEYLLFADVDHVVTEEVIEACNQYQGDRLNFSRRYGHLDEAGMPHAEPDFIKPSPSAFLCKKVLYKGIGGFDERFCGQPDLQPGDDTDFNLRWESVYGDPDQSQAALLVFRNNLDPRVFHSLRRNKKRDADQDKFLRNNP